MPETVSNKKGFKTSPLGEIPKDWEVRPAFEVCQAVIDCKNRTPPVIEIGHPVLRTMNVRDGRFVRQNLAYTDVRSYEIWTRRGKPRPGDILITREAPVGEACLIPEDMPEACLGQRMMMYQVDPSIMDNRFMVLSLVSEAVQSRLADLAGGSTVGHVRVDDIRQLFVHVPPISEQCQIADIINEIDSTITQTSTLIAKLKQMKAGLLHDLLTRRLDENGELRNAIDRPEQFKGSSLGQIPKDWEVGSLAAITDLQVGFAFKSEWFQENGGIRLLRGENVGYGSPDWSETRTLPWLMYPSYREYELCEGDIIIGMDRTFTKSGFKISILGASDIPALLVQRVGRFQPTNCDQRFLKALLNSQRYHNALLAQQKGMDIPHLSQSEILEPLVPIAPIPEQRAIATRIDAYDARIHTEESYLNKLKEQKKGLMHDLLTGRVRVTDLKEIPA